jgi:hypothetical protein
VEQGSVEMILRDARSAETQRLLAAGSVAHDSIAAERER